jgi:hypothetical protein
MGEEAAKAQILENGPEADPSMWQHLVEIGHEEVGGHTHVRYEFRATPN